MMARKALHIATKQGRPLVVGVVAIMIALAAAPCAATADPLASAWTRGFSNEARLVAGRADAGSGARLFAGFEIAMPTGWKTYWRTPGEAGGMPPEFDWSASDNLVSARVLYPAPKRLTDKSGTALGYKDRVLFPIEITAADPAKPITLRIKAVYGVCKELCVPAEADVTLEIPPAAESSGEIAEALAFVPRFVPRHGQDPMLANWSVETGSANPRLLIEVADPAGGAGDAFVEAPDGAYVPLPNAVGTKDGRTLYEVDLSDGVDIKALSGKALTVTLIGAKGQSETTITLK